MRRGRSVISKYLRLIFNLKSIILLNAKILAICLLYGIRVVGLSKAGFHRGAGRYAFVLMLFALATVPLPVANAAKVTLGWDSNPEPDLEGYVVYRNTGSPGPPYSYSDSIPEDDLVDPLHPKATLTGLQEGKEYYIALTAYNTEGVESRFSNDLCVEVVNNAAELCSTSSSPVTSPNASSGGSEDGSGNGSGGGCFISAASQMTPANYQLPGVLLISALIAAGFRRQKKRQSDFSTTETTEKILR